MKKNLIFYCTSFVLFIVSFLFFNSAHKEMLLYAERSSRAIAIHGTFQNLSRQINNAAVIHPDLIKLGSSKTNAKLFFTSSQIVNQQLSQLNRLISDSLNRRIIGELNKRIGAELPWILKSNVPDSIARQNATVHVAALNSIDSLIKEGIKRTNFLFEHRRQKFNSSIHEVEVRILVFLILGLLLLIYTTINLFLQQARREEKEKELEKREKRFRALVENSDDIIALLDSKLMPFYRSPSAARLTGYELAEKLGIHPEDLGKMKRCRQEIGKAPGKATPVKFRARHKLGHYIWLEGTFTNLLHNPAVNGIVANLRDVTGREKAEEELRRNMKELSDYKFALDESSIVAITDQKGTIRHVNKNFCAISKFNSEELIGRDHRIINSAFHPASFIRDLWVTLANGKIWKGELKNKAKDGSHYWVDTTIVPFLKEDEKPYQYLAIRSDITERKAAEEKLLKVNRLYAFISNINQAIVHIGHEQELLDHACAIATNTGRFKMAWTGMLEEGKLKMTSFKGDAEAAARILNFSELDYNDPAFKNIPTVKVLQTGKYCCNNAMQDDPALGHWREELVAQGIQSTIVLPIFKEGKLSGIFGIFAGIKDFFDTQEIALLEEAAGDISFALENFDKTKKHKNTEELVMNNERRFRSLIEKSTDMKTLTSRTGEFIYASPSVFKIFGYAEKEFLNTQAYQFFHPDHIPDLIKNRTAILEVPGSSFSFQYRLLHKNGNWIWCEGTLTNLLHEPGVEALVSNFKDISEWKLAEERRGFDRDNLDALINNTNDLLWSIDRNFNLITFNGPFYEAIKQSSGKTLVKGDSVFSAVLSQEQETRFRAFYARAFSGETFTEIDSVEAPVEYTAEISFYPIHHGSEIIGTACYSRNITERKKAEMERERMMGDLLQHSKNLEQFAYVVSHNLRAPVAHILGISEVLKGDISAVDRSRSQQFLYNAVEQLDVVVKDLNKILEVKSAISENRMEVNFREVLRGILVSIQDLAEKEQLSIQTEFEIETINSIQSYIYSIFYNLITNSIKYRKDDQPPVILIKSSVEEGKIKISFSDNGTGMDLEQYGDKVFGLYKRFHLNINGKGMGLFMVRTQVETLEGRISVKSSPGAGAEFTVEFPA